MTRRPTRGRTIPWRLRLPLIALLPLALLVHAAAARWPAIAEAYGRFVFPAIVRGLAFVSDRIPWSIAELVIGGLAIWTLVAAAWGLLRLLRRESTVRATAARLAVDLLALAGVLAAGEVALWSLNYERAPLASRAGWDTATPTIEELRALCEDLVVAANDARLEVKEGSDGVARLGATRREVLDRARLGYAGDGPLEALLVPGHAGRVKGFAIASPALSRVGLSGVYMPFTAEPTVNLDLPDVSIPWTACHEIAHQRGVAPEDEASFVGFLACSGHPDPEFRYSGALAALGHALRALRRADPDAAREIAARIAPGVRRDREAVAAFWRRHEGRLTRAGQRVNDAYLKSHGETAGVASYGLVVDLLIASRRER